jgi:hypothetical protein
VEPRLQFTVIRHRERWTHTLGMAKADVTAPLTDFFIAEGREDADGLAPGNAGNVGHRPLLPDGDAVVNLAGGVRNGFAVRKHVLDRERDRFLDVRDSLVNGLPLAVAAWKCRDDGHIASVAVGLQNDVVGALTHPSDSTTALARTIGSAGSRVGIDRFYACAIRESPGLRPSSFSIGEPAGRRARLRPCSCTLVGLRVSRPCLRSW